jgi:hypothetical protein
VLRAGHVPILLGPFAAGAAPATARALVVLVLQGLLGVADRMGLQAAVPLTLQADDDAAAELAGSIAALVPALGRDRLMRRLAAYASAPGDVDPDRARNLLSADLIALADAAAAWGPPFGAHTKAVLLCDDVHAWGPPAVGPGQRTALECLLAMTRSGDLGTAERPVPVVITGSTTEGGGQGLAVWSRAARHGLSVYRLEAFDEGEAALGYQWVLLHPWTTKPEDMREFRQVYTAAPGRREEWERGLRRVPRSPSGIDGLLYYTAALLTDMHVARSDDDEAAWRRYAEGRRGDTG